MRTLVIEPTLDDLNTRVQDEFTRSRLDGGKPRARREFVNTPFDMSLTFVIGAREWEYLQRFERVVGTEPFQFYASYRSDKKELFTGCFNSPVQITGRQGPTITATVQVVGRHNTEFNAANDEAFLDVFEASNGNPSKLEYELRDID